MLRELKTRRNVLESASSVAACAREGLDRAARLFAVIEHLGGQLGAVHVVTLAHEGVLMANEYASEAGCDADAFDRELTGGSAHG